MPACDERRLREGGASGEAVENTAYPFPSSLLDHRACVVFRIASVYNDRQLEATRQVQLRPEGTSLELTRRVVVVVVQPALAHGYGTVR